MKDKPKLNQNLFDMMKKSDPSTTARPQEIMDADRKKSAMSNLLKKYN